MKSLYYLFFVPVFLLLACGGDDTEFNKQQEQTDVPTADYDEISAELDGMEVQMAANPKDIETRKKAVTRMQDFASFFPDDPKAPHYLHKASDLALELDQDAKAVKLLERIQSDYPDYEKMMHVDYNRASHLDFELRDTTRAKEAYQFFIDKYESKYPDDNRISDSKLRIKYIRFGWEDYTNMIINGEIVVEPVL